MIRSPRLCEEIFKAERKRYTKQQLEKRDQKSMQVLLSNDFDPNNAEAYANKINERMHSQLKIKDIRDIRDITPSPPLLQNFSQLPILKSSCEDLGLETPNTMVDCTILSNKFTSDKTYPSFVEK